MCIKKIAINKWKLRQWTVLEKVSADHIYLTEV